MKNLRILVATAAALAALTAAAPAGAQLEVVSSGNVGIGTASPTHKLHLVGDLRVDGRLVAPLTVGTSGVVQPVISRNPEGGLLVTANGGVAGSADLLRVSTPAGAILFRVQANGTVYVNSTQVHPDYVFSDGYALESIEEHARSMWENKHLPAVGPGTYGEDGRASIDLGGKTLGMLEELEKAHIYIEQLHGRLQASEQQVVEVRTRNEELAQRLAALETALQRIGEDGR